MNTMKRLAQETGLPEEVIVRVITDKARDHRLALEAEAPEQGTPISLSEASRRYGVPVTTLAHWASDKRIGVIGRQENVAGRPLLVDERDVFFAMEYYRESRGRGRRPLRNFRPGMAGA